MHAEQTQPAAESTDQQRPERVEVQQELGDVEGLGHVGVEPAALRHG